MKDQHTTGAKHTPYSEEVSPDSLMSDFRGHSIVAIVAFTVVIHVLLIGVTSYGYLKGELFGEDSSTLSEEKRMEIAVKEATSSLRKIADRHNVSAQELSERFSSGETKPKSSPTTKPESTRPSAGTTAPEDGDTGQTPADEPDSAIEKDLQKKKDGPALPELPSIDDEDDLF